MVESAGSFAGTQGRFAYARAVARAGDETVDIAGAGPAGLAAAIVLARGGRRVRVFERRAQAGARFNGDFQGIENWTTHQDCLEELQALGIEVDWWMRSFDRCELIDGSLRRGSASAPRPLFYCVKRGDADEDSLDLSLLRQARAAGVDVIMGHRVDPSAVRVFAGGPQQRPAAIAHGVTCTLDLPDLSCTILDDELTPGGYAYLLVVERKATLGVVLTDRYAEARARLQRVADVVARRFGARVPEDVRGWTSHACFGVPRSAVHGRALWAGEAAGFQDALFGFGIRTAMVSGALAARAILDGIDYDEAWRRRLLPGLLASRANRRVFDRQPWLRHAAWWLLGRSGRSDRLLRIGYSLTPLHRALGHEWSPVRPGSPG